MRLTDAFATVLFYRAADGRRVFRPWGRLGKCYLVTDAQSQFFTKLYLSYSAIMAVSMIPVENLIGMRYVFLLVLPVWLAGTYLGFWVISRRLPETTPPPSPPPEYRRELLRGYNRALGRPFLWALEIGSLGFVGIGFYILLIDPTSRWTGVLCVAFFGLCAMTFARQLRNM
jgi:hypothetical protein